MDSRGPIAKTAAQDLVILCVGHIDRLEFREVRSTLEPWGTVIAAPDSASALLQLAQESSTPDVVVVAQSYPGELADSQIDTLRRVAPLARFVAVLGSWCEGEMRSGSPWSGAVRVYWHQWAPQCQRELQRLVSGRESLWSLPLTACEEERCLAMAARKDRGKGVCPPGGGPTAPANRLVEIATRQYDLYGCLAAACVGRGWETRWRRDSDDPPNDPPAVVVFDAAGQTARELARFRQLQIGRGVPAVVLADFPRAADRDRFVQAGARAVLSRPFFWDDLFWYFPPNECSVTA